MATALVDYGRLHSIEPKPEEVEEFENFPGEGIHGKINGNDIFVGNEKIALRAGCKKVPVLDGVATEGKSIGYIFLGATQAGFFSLSDDCRTGIKEALDQLKSMGIKVAMLTGDNKESTKFVQNKLEDALDIVRAELLPQDKAQIIKDFQKEAPTAMVGDGLNDTPALAIADIGISIGISGSALANETSHVILMSNDIRKIPEVVRLARKTHRKILENIALSILPKVAIVALAFAGHPLVWAAVLFDVGTCVIVILSSMLLLNANLKHKIEEQSRRIKEYDGHNSSNSPLYDSLLPDPTKSESRGCCPPNSSSKCHKPLQKTSCCAQKKKNPEDKSCAEKQKHSNHESFNAFVSKKCCSGPTRKSDERCNKSILSHPGSTSQISEGMADSSCCPTDEEQGYVDDKCCLALNDDDSSKCRRHDVDYSSLDDSEEFVLLGGKGMHKRASGGCCKSYRNECCVKNGYSLFEIVIE